MGESPAPLQHGFQSMLYLLLPPRALLYEVFPHRYYKHGYKRAALEWGLSHGRGPWLNPCHMSLPHRVGAVALQGGRIYHRGPLNKICILSYLPCYSLT
jgi:hypothetical protein